MCGWMLYLCAFVIDLINVMNPDGSMNEQAGATYKGMDRFACRKQLVNDLKEQNFLVNVLY